MEDTLFFWQEPDLVNEPEPESFVLIGPEPARLDTGHMVAVEWEGDTGYRWWEVMDEGHISAEAWLNQRWGTGLSDVDEVAEGAES